ncbi:hypothetical protein JIQ42_04918 [Leishmania sp. Namibia]|uniref:hypothetical protein n=1 Tax=Leishmania sp. Namibia TaxID=2802991 RepID=UPI001B456268|nr:hypothetical protein JIQ42_04918 [Leishmania sp. Namibia]
MDVSQFLKSFKKNVAAKARLDASLRHTAEATGAGGDEDVMDILHSASDDEANGEAENEEAILGRRADKMAGKRYAASASRLKRNQEFAALKVMETNSAPAVDAGRFQRQRATLAMQARDTRKLPRIEMVASVRAELLRKREQLQSCHALDPAGLVAAPIQKVEEMMLKVDDLLHDSSPTGILSAATLDFVPAASPPAAPQSTPTATSSALLAGGAPDEPEEPPSLERNTTASASSSKEARAEEPPVLPKKRSKFEIAMTLARDDKAS